MNTPKRRLSNCVLFLIVKRVVSILNAVFCRLANLIAILFRRIYLPTRVNFVRWPLGTHHSADDNGFELCWNPDAVLLLAMTGTSGNRYKDQRSACIDCVTSWRHGTYGTVIKSYRLGHFVELSVSYGFLQLQFIDITTTYTIDRLSLYCPNAFFLYLFRILFLTPFCLVIIINEVFCCTLGPCSLSLPTSEHETCLTLVRKEAIWAHLEKREDFYLREEDRENSMKRCFIICDFHRIILRGSAVAWGTALQAGRSRVRFPLVSLEFFIGIILPAAL